MIIRACLFLVPQVGASHSPSTLQLAGLWFLLRPGLEWKVTCSVCLLSLRSVLFQYGIQYSENRFWRSPLLDSAKINTSGEGRAFPFPLHSFITLLDTVGCCPGLSFRSPLSLGKNKVEGPGVLWHGKLKEKSLYWKWGDLGSKFSSVFYQLFNHGQV